MKKSIIILVCVVILAVIIWVIMKATDYRWSTSPYSESRVYICAGGNIPRDADFRISFYNNEKAVWLYPFQDHPQGVKLTLESESSGATIYKGGGANLSLNDTISGDVIRNRTATLTENGKVLFDRCGQIMPGV